MEKLDLENVRIYSNTKAGIIDAMDLIGQDVYMSDDENFEDYYKYKLVGVKVIDDYCRFLGNEGKETYTFAYKHFILVKDVKFKEEKEKKLRPFKDIEEFRRKIGCAVGNVITYKKKNSGIEYSVLFHGYARINDNVAGIYLGRRSYTLKELRDNYHYYNAGEWLPFGVEE